MNLNPVMILLMFNACMAIIHHMLVICRKTYIFVCLPIVVLFVTWFYVLSGKYSDSSNGNV